MSDNAEYDYGSGNEKRLQSYGILKTEDIVSSDNISSKEVEDNEYDYGSGNQKRLQSYDVDFSTKDPSILQKMEPSIEAGGYSGASAAGTAAIREAINRSSQALPMARLAYNLHKGRIPNAINIAQSISEIAPQLNQKQIFTILSKVPEGGYATFNYAKSLGLSDAQAMKISGYSEAQDIVESRAAGISKAQKLFPNFAPRSAGNMIALPENIGTGPSIRFEGQQPRVPLPPPQSAPSGLSAAGEMFSGAAKSIGSNIAKSGLAGAGVGFGGAEAYRNYKEGDIPSFVLNSIGALGSSIVGLAPYFGKAALAAPYAAPFAVGAPLAALGYQGAKEERKMNVPIKKSYLAREARLPETSPEEIEFTEAMGPATSRQGLGFRP